MNQDAFGAVWPVICGGNRIGNGAVGYGIKRAFFNNGNVGIDILDDEIVNFVNVCVSPCRSSKAKFKSRWHCSVYGCQIWYVEQCFARIKCAVAVHVEGNCKTVRCC